MYLCTFYKKFSLCIVVLHHTSTFIVRELLNIQFGGKWVERGGLLSWPDRSPDLNPIHFYLWGNMKSLIHSSPVESIETLPQLINEASEVIRDQPGIFERI